MPAFPEKAIRSREIHRELKWSGDYTPDRVYEFNDVVRYAGFLWRAQLQLYNTTPPVSAVFDDHNWDFLVPAFMTGADIVTAINNALGGTSWQGGGAGSTNLSIANRTATSFDVTSDTGADATLPAVSITEAGLLTAADKVKLDGIAAGADNFIDTDLSIANRTATTFNILSSTGLDATAPEATSTLAGLLTAADKTKLDGIAAGATLYTDEMAQDAVGAMLNNGGDITWSYVDVTPALSATINANAVSFAKMQDIATARFVGRITALAGDPEELTGTQATSLLDSATTALKGLMSAADKTKIDGIETGAQVNVATNLSIINSGATTLDVASSTGIDVTLPAATPVAGTNKAGLMVAADKTRLDITLMAPQGRLTLESGVGVSVFDQAAKTTIYFTPYLGPLAPFWDGTKWTLASFSELSLALDGNGLHTGYHQAGKNFDLFLDYNAGAPRLVSGPAWTNDTTRADALARQNGLWVNNASIVIRFGTASGDTATIGAKLLTYVGTFRVPGDGSNGQTQIKFGSSAAGGGKAGMFIWNAYNRVKAICNVQDLNANWVDNGNGAYHAFDPASTGSGLNNRVEMVRGLNEDPVNAVFGSLVSTSNGVTGILAIGVDSSTVQSGVTPQWNSSLLNTLWARHSTIIGLGFHFIQAEAYSAGSSVTYYGNGNSGLYVELYY